MRECWTESLVRKILGEPEQVAYNKNGAVTRCFWSLEKVVEGESHPDFLKKKEKDDAQEARKASPSGFQRTPFGGVALAQEKAKELSKALQSDLLTVDIPDTGDLEEIYNNLLSQIEEFSLLLKASHTVSFEAYQKVYGVLRNPEINPYCQLYKKIGENRQDLAFECGTHYMAKLYDTSFEKPWYSKTVTVKGKKLVT